MLNKDMSHETSQHKKIKEIVLSKLKEVYGTGLTEYADGGQVNDICVLTPDNIKIFVEVIWKADFEHDLIIMHNSPADIKIVIVNPEILHKERLCREFVKSKMSEIQRGVQIPDMINGELILSEPKFVDKEFVAIVGKLLEEARKKKDIFKNDPIIVVPESITLNFSQWNVRTQFSVYNRSENCYFQIWVKLTFEEPSITYNQIRVNLAKPRDLLDIGMGNIVFSGDVLRIDFLDKKGYKIIFLLLSNIDPSETIHFILDSNSSDVSFSGPSRIFLKVSSFSNEPSMSINRVNGNKKISAMRIKPPESGTLKGTWILRKRHSV